MVKLSERNRGAVFLAGTILVGLIFIGIAMLVENKGSGRVKIINDPPPPNDKILGIKIDNLSTQTFNPTSYNTLATEIEASNNENLITGATKSYLLGRLKSTYTTLVYNQCNLYLTSNSAKSSRDILSWLAQLENISSRNTQIDFYRNQIKLYEYYSNGLPAEVNRFIQGGTTLFDEPTYLRYKGQVQNMPGFDERYSNTTKFNSIKTSLISGLNSLYNEFYAL